MSYRPICDVWMLARCKYKDGKKRYGGYLGGFPERARALLGATLDDPVLHVCGGKARQYPYKGGFGPNDKTLDLDPSTKPDIRRDARLHPPIGWQLSKDAPLFMGGEDRAEWLPFKAMLIDPPYSVEDAAHYPPGGSRYPSPGLLVQNAIDVLPVGGRVGIIHYICPRRPKPSKFVACVGIISGFNNRIRVFSVFEKTDNPS